MKASFDARQAILARIRSATQGAEKHAYANLPRTYIRHGKLPHPLVSELMIERLREYGADVVEAAPAELPAVLVRQLQSSGRSTFVAPPGLPVDRLAPEIDWKIDMGLTHDQVEQCDGVVTAAFAGVADSGTIVLHHSAAEGRRLITLLPDWHLCILRTSQLVETLPEYFERCPYPPPLATYISGPSATADIEMTRIKGVHGPRFLNIILVHDEKADERVPMNV